MEYKRIFGYRVVCCTFLCLFFINQANVVAQKVYISKYIYGNLTKDDNHYIELFNESPTAANISNGFIVTRNYSLRLPDNIILQPFHSIRLGKLQTATRPLDIEFLMLKDFLIRFPATKEEGDYVVCMDKDRQILDAVCFSPTSKPPRFLPDRASLITGRGDAIDLDIPAPSHPKWKYLEVNLDPAMALVQIHHKWQITSRKKNLLPATDYEPPQINWVEGIITVKWQSLFETDCFFHTLERSLDGEHFIAIYNAPASKQSLKPQSYMYYDKNIQKNQQYFYRIKNIDKFRNEVVSPTATVSSAPSAENFLLQIIEQSTTNSPIALRFSAKFSGQVKIQLMDEQFRAKEVLFDDEVLMGKEHWLKYEKKLAIGKYFLIAETPQRRYYQVIEIRE
jgi:hypothetical protein